MSSDDLRIWFRKELEEEEVAMPGGGLTVAVDAEGLP